MYYSCKQKQPFPKTIEKRIIIIFVLVYRFKKNIFRKLKFNKYSTGVSKIAKFVMSFDLTNMKTENFIAHFMQETVGLELNKCCQNRFSNKEQICVTSYIEGELLQNHLIIFLISEIAMLSFKQTDEFINKPQCFKVF